METSFLDIEQAFLHWFNQLARQQITSLTELKDGVTLMKLLSMV
jgi:hypothetical protein